LLGFAIHVLRDAKLGHEAPINGALCPLSARYAGLASFIKRSAGEWQKRNMAGLLYRCGHGSLVSRAGAGLAAWTDRAIFGDILAQQICLFVVNCQSFICTELTKFRLGKEAAFPTAFHTA
jgi:hypothetical protein